MTYLSVAGMTPAAPFVLILISSLCPSPQLTPLEETYGAVTTLPPEAFTSLTYLFSQRSDLTLERPLLQL